jgi:2-polyprenyl-6-methoxyphenol hydroxylase-like FAD-dependent oxidoreductase
VQQLYRVFTSTIEFPPTIRRSNYPPTFLDRQVVLEVLYSHIKDKNKVLVGKRVDRIDHKEDGVTVHCTDGTSFHGDVIAGADGVQSQVRREMWAAADEQEPGAIPKEDKESMTAEYKCLFGIATQTNNYPAGYVDITYAKDKSSLCITGKDGRFYFFMFEKMDKVYHHPDIPKFTTTDAEAFADSFRDFNIVPKDFPTGAIKFSDVWKNRTSHSLVALEEAEYQRWTWGRFVCIGDGIHKMTPNAGLGGNSAIESAAALANALYDLRKSNINKNPSRKDIEASLATFQKGRQERVSAIVTLANKVTRIHALKSWSDKFTAYWAMPLLGDTVSDLATDMYIGAIKIDYLPVPERSLKGDMPFNPDHGCGKKESYLKRFLLGLPLIAIMFVAFRSLPSASDVLTPWQLPSFLTDYGVLYSILLVESTRRANALNPLTYL